MKRGKQTCRILKEIRRQIAEVNDIEFITSECQYQEDCLGTCPKCETEVRYLEQQLERKRMAGKAITILGISAGVMTMNAQNTNSSKCQSPKDTIETIVQGSDTLAIPKKVPTSQPVAEEAEEEEDFLLGYINETMPQFPGGNAALMKFIAENYQYPTTLQDSNIVGRVIVQFTIDKEGYVVEPKVVRSLHPDLDKEALRVIRLLPQWKPASQRGIPVCVKYTVPVTFKQKPL